MPLFGFPPGRIFFISFFLHNCTHFWSKFNTLGKCCTTLDENLFYRKWGVTCIRVLRSINLYIHQYDQNSIFWVKGQPQNYSKVSQPKGARVSEGRGNPKGAPYRKTSPLSEKEKGFGNLGQKRPLVGGGLCYKHTICQCADGHVWK